MFPSIIWTLEQCFQRNYATVNGTVVVTSNEVGTYCIISGSGPAYFIICILRWLRKCSLGFYLRANIKANKTTTFDWWMLHTKKSLTDDLIYNGSLMTGKIWTINNIFKKIKNENGNVRYHWIYPELQLEPFFFHQVIWAWWLSKCY